MVAAFHKLGDKCIMSDANVVICKIIAIYKGHNENKYCAKLVVDRLVLTYIRQSQIFTIFHELTLIAVVVPLVEELAQWPQDACRRSELKHDIHCLRFSEYQRGQLLQVHGCLCFAEMCYELS